MTKLKLDFSIPQAGARKEFLDNYIKDEPYSNEDLEMMGNYLLWGKDENGKNAVQRKEVEIETRHKTWQKKDHESLDALIENPAFNESIIHTDGAPIKLSRQAFSRKEALENSPDYLKVLFENLFKEIDTLDLLLNYYDLDHGKRKNPPREELLERFNEKEQNTLFEKAQELNQFKYLKLRHELVELRRQQFTLRDGYITTIQTNITHLPGLFSEATEFENNIEVFPLGLKSSNSSLSKIFLEEDLLNPFSFSDKDLEIVMEYFWEKKNAPRKGLYIDFCEGGHLSQLFDLYHEVGDVYSLSKDSIEVAPIIETLMYYVGFTHLGEVQQKILDMKIEKKSNKEIADFVNFEFGKSYTVNYISTIFHQKIIPAIAETARFHMEIIEALPFKEDFKECNCCGELFLIHPRNFVRKSRSKDGFATRCKECDKAERERKK